ncbi:homeobox protein vent1-like [Platysternon megacephalum]|uniref:Homeobox protein vent1-like n=1 Tax=Platysternon megacephalum TaxID=55544 RepID=A0A4D9EGW3_9SAUR|nr:homeobox protein vent1-like [Platysternon megacephalum]
MSVGCACPGCSSKSFKLYSPKEPPNGNAFPPFHPGTMLDRDVGPTPMYPPTYLEPGIGRHTPYGNQTDYRIFELNKRLQNWTEECDNLWWDAFTTEFFEDDAMLTITFCLEDGPKRYTIGRTLIPRYFRSIFEGGATELYYVLKHPKESFHNNFVSLDCDQCTMVTQHGKPMFTQVCVEGRLYLEFMFDDMMRIKTWHFSIRQHRELIPRSILAMHAQDPQMLDQLSKNITRCGLSNSTLNYLRLCVILEPMQELMSRHKTYSLSPRDCLKTCLFQKWQRMVAPPAEPARQQPSKRRKRKMSGGSTMSSSGGNANNSNSKKKSPASTFALSSQVPVSIPFPFLFPVPPGRPPEPSPRPGPSARLQGAECAGTVHGPAPDSQFPRVRPELGLSSRPAVPFRGHVGSQAGPRAVLLARSDSSLHGGPSPQRSSHPGRGRL